eukprot:274757_1
MKQPQPNSQSDLNQSTVSNATELQSKEKATGDKATSVTGTVLTQEKKDNEDKNDMPIIDVEETKSEYTNQMTSTSVSPVQKSSQSKPTLDSEANPENNSHFEVFDGHKFHPIDRIKEAELTHIKWTLNWRIGFIFCILGLLWWIVGVIGAINDHTTMPFCDTTEPLFYSCNALSERQTASLCEDYCTNGEPCWIKLEDTDDGYLWDYVTVDNQRYPIIVNGWCADFNNESEAMFYCRIFFLIILLLWCFKVFKQIWKGIELPPLETEKVTGFKRILKIPDRISDKLYDLRINLRSLVEKIHKNNNIINNKFYKSEQNFVNIMWSGFVLLFTMQFFLMELPLNILNLSSTSLLLKLIGGVEMIKDVIVLWKLTRCRMKGRIVGDKQHNKMIHQMSKRYPERNIEFAYFYFFLQTFCMVNALIGMFGLMMSYFALPSSNFDSWLRAITIFKHIYRLFWVMSKVFRLFIIVTSSFSQKITVSKRESLLVKDIFKLFLVWSIFKIEIKDDDEFIFVDEKRGSAETIVFDGKKTTFNSFATVISSLLVISLFWGLGCYFTLGNGEFEWNAFQDSRF